MDELRALIRDFDEDEWEGYRKSKGLWRKDWHVNYRNFSMGQLTEFLLIESRKLAIISTSPAG